MADIKNKVTDAAQRVTGAASSATSGVRTGAENAVDKVRSVKAIDGAVDFVTSLAAAFKKVGQGVFNSKDQASAGAKFVGRVVGSAGSGVSSVVGAIFRGGSSLNRGAPLLAVIATVLLGGAFVKSWMNDRAAKNQQNAGSMPQPPQPSTNYYNNATQADMAGPTGQNVQRFAPNGPALPGQSRAPVGTGQPGQGF